MNVAAPGKTVELDGAEILGGRTASVYGIELEATIAEKGGGDIGALDRSSQCRRKHQYGLQTLVLCNTRQTSVIRLGYAVYLMWNLLVD